jgi:hypothetical protein
VPNLSRRDALRWSAAVGGGLLLAPVLAACTSGDGQPAPTDPGGPEDPDRALRAEIGRSESQLVVLYAAATAKLGGTAAPLVAGIGARHQAYRQAIDPDQLATLAPSALATESAASGSASPSVSPAATAVPTLPSGEAGILAALRDAEQSAAAERATQCVRAVDPELARIVALAGAGCAGAAEALTRIAP